MQYTTPVTWTVLGLISGTSMDGIDVAGAELRLVDGTIELRPSGSFERAYPAELRDRLHAALPPAGCDAKELCALDTEVGREFGAAARGGREVLGAEPDLICSLGQTLYHWVEDGRARGTLQLGRPAWIAEATGAPVVSDLRSRDVAAGGQGAPLAGVLDALWLADQPGTTAALNLGGIANLTVVGGPRPLAYDTGPGNALLDAAARVVTGQPQDTGGALAARGEVRADLLDALLADPYYARSAPKSTGKEHFNAEYLQGALAQVDDVDGADLLATLTELTARTVAEACRAHEVDSVIASGGGTANPALMRALRADLGGIDLRSSDLGTSSDLGSSGLPAAGKEAYLAALLGFLTVNGLPGNAPGTTGASGPRLLGSITPGDRPLRLPEPATAPARRVRVLAHGADHRLEVPCDPSTS